MDNLSYKCTGCNKVFSIDNDYEKEYEVLGVLGIDTVWKVNFQCPICLKKYSAFTKVKYGS